MRCPWHFGRPFLFLVHPFIASSFHRSSIFVDGFFGCGNVFVSHTLVVLAAVVACGGCLPLLIASLIASSIHPFRLPSFPPSMWLLVSPWKALLLLYREMASRGGRQCQAQTLKGNGCLYLPVLDVWSTDKLSHTHFYGHF
ncbi:hypothetical protein K437DRAFT_45576 [Tilletiaria anomala UBC 951]|uniref:Uncharacterized protein n=1 Tax=Tilletiaria anomala (strain ATCC 24038 / CBS 436.72 / UBC 951) TaxID=1037660 RepID=A0A066WLY5_TILAU|nr:uncharacterized protein K437DRAFT_45576 [Tilletiaria anomala UBC 951]KDN52009.1 hypothetical protein K437DRAFT_45576 [Tilletiaria anomala UBC 951]